MARRDGDALETSAGRGMTGANAEKAFSGFLVASLDLYRAADRREGSGLLIDSPYGGWGTYLPR